MLLSKTLMAAMIASPLPLDRYQVRATRHVTKIDCNNARAHGKCILRYFEHSISMASLTKLMLRELWAPGKISSAQKLQAVATLHHKQEMLPTCQMPRADQPISELRHLPFPSSFSGTAVSCKQHATLSFLCALPEDRWAHA